jgi:hypothetical protein
MTQFEIKDGVAIIPEGMTEIPFRAFINCEDLTTVVIPDSVTCIVNGAFFGCSSLTEIVIPSSVTSIGASAFSHCSSLKNIVIPNSVTSIGEGAFSRCYSLKNVVIPNGVTSIGDKAFCCSSSMRRLVIRNIRKLVTENETTTVKNASSLTSVTLPESLTKLGKDVFLGCEKLETIYVPAKKANFYREHLPETLHDKIVEFEPEQK